MKEKEMEPIKVDIDELIERYMEVLFSPASVGRRPRWSSEVKTFWLMFPGLDQFVYYEEGAMRWKVMGDEKGSVVLSRRVLAEEELRRILKQALSGKDSLEIVIP